MNSSIFSARGRGRAVRLRRWGGLGIFIVALLAGGPSYAESHFSERAWSALPFSRHELDSAFDPAFGPRLNSFSFDSAGRWMYEDPTRYYAAKDGVAGGGSGETAATDLELMAKKANNPLSDVWLLITETDISVLGGNDVSHNEIQNVTLFEPVLPVPVLDEKYNLIFRPILSVVSSPLDKDVGKLFGKTPGQIAGSPRLLEAARDPYGDRTSGLGDSVLLTLFGPNRDDGLVFGGGVTHVFPTATEDVLGQQKWQVGPAALVIRLGKDHGGLGIESWNLGFLAQQWFSYAGTGDREAVNRMNLQYFINWKMNATQLVGMTPNIVIDWEEKDIDDAISLPIGLGTIGIFRLGKLPMRWGVEAQYFVVQNQARGPRFNLKLFIAPIILNPLK